MTPEPIGVPQGIVEWNPLAIDPQPECIDRVLNVGGAGSAWKRGGSLEVDEVFGVSPDLLSGQSALIAAVLVFSAALQTSTGFGFAMLSAPVLAVLVGPVEAVSTIVATGVVVDVLVLAAGGRRPQPHGRDVLTLGLWSVPGLLAGALLLRTLPSAALKLLVAGAVLLAVGHRLRLRRIGPAAAAPSERWWSAAPAGIASGVLSTATTLGGPPIVLYLTRRPRPPRETRDTLVALSLLRLPLSVAALVLAGTWVQPQGLVVLWIAVALGYVIGRWVFARMDPARYEQAVLGALVVAALTAVATAVA